MWLSKSHWHEQCSIFNDIAESAALTLCWFKSPLEIIYKITILTIGIESLTELKIAGIDLEHISAFFLSITQSGIHESSFF